MLFTSLEFIFVFLPIVLGVNYFLPPKAKNYWLLLASLFFYAWGEPKFVLAMLASILMNYLMALWIDRYELKNEDGNVNKRNQKLKKLFLGITVVLNLSILFVYKYMNFTTSILSEHFTRFGGWEIQQTNFILPIGISFFTFQAMSYVIDVYRGVPVQKNIAYIGLYISLFPQLIAGPIVRYTTVAEEIERRTVTFDDFSKGVMRFLCGFNKKMLLANVLSKAADVAFASTELCMVLAWLGIICYTLQIYFDFSGYSEMAIGLGKMLGFNFLENFNYPYISKTITEFWRRWHISLGSWFRDYIYFPLGGSRVKTKARLIFNLAIVWIATGIWHGANWTFVLWGIMYGVIIIFEKIVDLPKRLPKHKILAILYQIFTMFAVMMGWVLFRADSLEVALDYLRTLFGVGNVVVIDDIAIFNIREYIIPLFAGILCSTPLFKWIHTKCMHKSINIGNVYELGTGILQILLFLVGISYLVINAHNPFIYFNF